jgi:hypothetical protein
MPVRRLSHDERIRVTYIVLQSVRLLSWEVEVAIDAGSR